jgi:biotin-[acetyl-CoA-carboxylase] ligase BirA-like protein
VICLTDGSRFARELAGCLGAMGGGRPLQPADRELWSLVHAEPEGAVAFPASTLGSWSCLVIVEQASRSQFDALADATAAGLTPGPVAAVAGTCARLRGFHGRTWESARGNLHLTAALPLDGLPAATALPLVLVPTLAARDALVAASASVLSPRIKWVNDLYLDDGKVGGVLTRTQVMGARAELLLVGIGVNVRSAPALALSPFVPRAAAAREVELGVLLRETLTALERRHREALDRGFASMLAEYRAASNVIGRRVRVYADGTASAAPGEWPPLVAAGVVREIRDDLSLAIDGAPVPVSRGRLAFESDCRAAGLAPLARDAAWAFGIRG